MLNTSLSVADEVSLNFDKVDVRFVLKKLAEHYKQNIIVAPNVSGKISVNVYQLNWQEVLAAIEKSHSLSIQRQNNVWVVDQSQPKPETSIVEEKRQLRAIHTEYLDFTKLNEQVDVLIGELGNKARVIFDDHTHQLMVYSQKTEYQRIKDFIESVDKPVRQVEIEARIVLANQDESKKLGVSLGFFAGEPSLYAAGGFQYKQALADVAGIKALSNEATSLQRVIGQGVGETALVLSELSLLRRLDVMLSAIEANGAGEVISRPRLVTSDRTEAIIESGEEIPFQSSNTKQGQVVYSTAFKKAVLALKVLPRIMQNDQIKLRLVVTQNTRGALTDVGPAINTQKIETEVLVNDGETLVLGGIYSKNKQNKESRVPLLGRLPVIGFFFRKTNNIDNKRELLIFVTPKILDEQNNVTL